MQQKVSRIIHTVVCVAIISTLILPLTAFIPHADPEKAEIIYDGISLFRYYSEILDHILAGDQDKVGLEIEKIPLANLPDSLRATTDDLTSSMYDVSQLLIDINQDMLELNSLLKQHRLSEALSLSGTIKQNIATAVINVNLMDNAVETTGITRYPPAVAYTIMNVTKTLPVLTMDLPPLIATAKATLYS